MLPGDTAPLPLTDRIVIALDQLRIARLERDPDRELGWESMLNRLLDALFKLLQASGQLRPLSETDPELDAHLKPGIRYVEARR